MRPSLFARYYKLLFLISEGSLVDTVEHAEMVEKQLDTPTTYQRQRCKVSSADIKHRLSRL